MIIIAIIVIVLALLTALIVLMRSPMSAVHRWLAIFIVSACIWIISSNIHSLVGPQLGIIVVRASFAAALMLGFSMMMFVRALIVNKGHILKFSIPVLIFGEIVSFTNLVIERYAEYNVAGGTIPIRGPAYIFVIGLTLIFMIIAVVKLTKALKKAQGARRDQLALIEWGLIIGTLVGLITNAILPNIVKNTSPGRFAFLAIIIWTVCLVYAIVQHRFLDIRLAAARAVTYVLTLGILATLLIGGIVLGIWIFLDGAETGGLLLQSLYVVAALVIAIVFHPLKLQLDRLTNRLFFKNPYDTKQILDKVGSILVKEVETDRILTKVGEIIMRTIAPTRIQLLVVRGRDRERSIFLGRKGEAPIEDIVSLANSNLNDLVFADEIDQNSNRLNQLLVQNNLALSVRLQILGETLGYIIIGNKSDGAAFTRQDVDLLRIITSELAVALQNALRFEEVSQFNEKLEAEIEDATKELRRKNERLRLLDQTKDDFISMASHQLRTPLTSVKGYVSMVLDGDAGKVTELQKKLLTQSFLSSQRMVYLISDLLNVSRLRTGKFVIEPVETNLSEVIEGEVEQLQETAKGRELTLTYKKPEHFPPLMIDENKLRQVIMNFIDNAIYYTPAKGHITVNLVDRPDSIEFTVVDDGIGVPKAEQHHLFSKFYRAHNAKRARPDGTGLGLFMAKKVIIAQGGAVIFKSQEGKGSTFGFTFPKKKLLSKTNLPDDKPVKS